MPGTKQGPAEAPEKTEVRQAELPAKSFESATEDMSIVMEDEIAQDAPVPPEELVARITEPEEPTAPPTPIEESATKVLSDPAPAESAPPLTKVELS
jgi:hypothetical protein